MKLKTAAAIAVICTTACSNPEQKPALATMPNPIFQAEKFTPPHPEKKPKELTAPKGQKRTDEYYWLNERENPAVRGYLEAENRYFDSVMTPVAPLRDKIFEEMVARVKQDDNSVPYFKNGYWYYTRFETGKEYPIHARKKATLDASEEILVNVNEVAAGHEYCQVGALTVSPDNQTLFYAVDFTGRNLFKSVFKNLQTGKILGDSFDLAEGEVAWANDSKSIVYATKDAVTLRFNKIWRHQIGTPTTADPLLFEEKDETKYAYLSKSKSEKYIFVQCGYTEIQTAFALDADFPAGAKFQKICPEQKGVFYSLDHFEDKFFIRTNDGGAKNFKLMETPVANFSKENWKEFLPHRADALLDGFEIFKDHLAVMTREGGLKRIKIYRWDDASRTPKSVDFGEPTYDVDFGANPEFDTKNLRYHFSSLKTPPTVVDFDMATSERTVKKVEPILGNFSSENYQTEFVWATAADGVRVPISLVYKKGVRRDGSAPCYIFGYGSYGSSYDPAFNKVSLSLLDRGFVIANAHIRGGMEMGYSWYEDGKMLKKMNTFTDFIACADHLVKEKYTSPERLFGSGRSAGGLLMGAVANLRPDLFKGLVVGVPFVDVLTTMSDASIPLTTGEYTEWGNPAVAAEYEYMARYSPYDNISDKNYPNLYVSTSLSDSQVQYFEPAKWVARLRDQPKNRNMIIFKTNMSGSHGGSSGRFEKLKERASEYAWMMGLLGMDDKKMAN